MQFPLRAVVCIAHAGNRVISNARYASTSAFARFYARTGHLQADAFGALPRTGCLGLRACLVLYTRSKVRDSGTLRCLFCELFGDVKLRHHLGAWFFPAQNI